jgi:RecB family exonuclease
MTSESVVAPEPGVVTPARRVGSAEPRPAWVDVRPDPAVMATHLDSGGDPFELVERPGWFSYTSFDSFARCPRQYALRYLCRQPEELPAWPAAEYGSAAHAAFEQYTRERRERAARDEFGPTRDELGRWFDDAFAQTSLALGPDGGRWRSKAEPMLDLFWSAEQPGRVRALEAAPQPATDEAAETSPTVEPAPPPDTVGEEIRFRLPLELDPDTSVVVSGYIDRVDRLPGGGVEVIDYKSGNGDPTRAAASLQLGIYALGCRDSMGLGRPARVTLYYVERGIRAGAERSDDELDELRLDLASRARAIRASSFPETPGPGACRWCDFAVPCGKAVASEAS